MPTHDLLLVKLTFIDTQLHLHLLLGFSFPDHSPVTVARVRAVKKGPYDYVPHLDGTPTCFHLNPSITCPGVS
jgi:hypothetical protein